MIRDEVWIFGEIDIETNRVVAKVCDYRSAETLIPIITSTVNSNAIIWSDKWKAYDTLNNYGLIIQLIILKFLLIQLSRSIST